METCKKQGTGDWVGIFQARACEDFLLVGVQKRKTGEPEAVNKFGKRTKSRELETKWEFLKPQPGGQN